MLTFVLNSELSIKEDMEIDKSQNYNRYNNFDLIELKFLKGLLERENSLFSFTTDLFEDYGKVFYKIMSDYTFMPENGNLVFYYESDNSCNFNYRFEINFSYETVTIVAVPKPFLRKRNFKNDGGSDARTTHPVKTSLLSLRFLKYLRGLFLYQLAYSLKVNYNMADNKFQEGDEEEARYFADKTKENVEKIGQIEYIVDKTCLQYYGFEKSYKTLSNSNPY